MSAVVLSRGAFPELIEYLVSRGHTPELLEDDPGFGPGVGAHADLRLCRVHPSGPVLRPPFRPARPRYPENAALCALVLEGFLVHRLDITHLRILQYCRERGFREIDVRQGYARCSCLPVDGRSVITSDPGLIRALSALPEITVLPVTPGFVALPGYETGFIGGAAGRVGDEVLFNGDLTRHPDFRAITDFIASRGLRARWFGGGELTDIGSVVEL